MAAEAGDRTGVPWRECEYFDYGDCALEKMRHGCRAACVRNDGCPDKTGRTGYGN